MKKSGWLFAALLLCGKVWAVDGISVEAGDGDQTETGRIGIIWDWQKQWFTEHDWLLTGYWEANAGTWRGKSPEGHNQTVKDLGVTPVFRLQKSNPSAVVPYFEGAIGFHLITPTYIYETRKFGSAFQFGDHIGFGIRFGERHRFDLGYRFQHLSDGHIKEPNQGINISELHFVYRF